MVFLEGRAFSHDDEKMHFVDSQLSGTLSLQHYPTGRNYIFENMTSKCMLNSIIQEVVTVQSGGEIVLFHFAKHFWKRWRGGNLCVSKKIHQGFRKPL